MSKSSDDDKTLKSDYAARVTADLEHNASEQARITSELESLQNQLRRLEEDRVLLQGIERALAAEAEKAAETGVTTGADQPAEEAAPAATSKGAKARSATRNAAKDTAAKAARPKATTAKSATGKVPRMRKPKTSQETAVKPRKKSVAAKGGAKASKNGSGQSSSAGKSTLKDLIAGQLAEANEPRSAAELTKTLAEHDPGRRVSPTVVRNTLESLVAKGQALRTKQQRSVFYSPADPAPAAESPKGSETPAGA